MPPKYEIRAKERLKSCLKRYLDVIATAESEGFNESDTAAIVQEILAEGLGYQKFFEITSEFQIKRHYADFAIKLEGKVKYFVEVKSIGSVLSERDLFQVQSYSASHNLRWMVLTNGRIWRCYHLSAGSPPSVDKVFEVDLLTAGDDPEPIVERLYLLSKEAMWRDRISEYWELARATSPETIAGCLLSERVLQNIRREIRRRTSQNVEASRIAEILTTQVIKGNLSDSILTQKAKTRSSTKKARRRLPAICYAYVPDPDNPSTWKLRYRKRDGTVDKRRLAAAVAALSPGGLRGRRVQIPDEHIAEVKAKLREAYQEIGAREEDIPPGLKV